ILFSIGVMLSQMHSGNGLLQRGQSRIASAAAADSLWLGIRPLYAASTTASTTEPQSRLSRDPDGEDRRSACAPRGSPLGSAGEPGSRQMNMSIKHDVVEAIGNTPL